MRPISPHWRRASRRCRPRCGACSRRWWRAVDRNPCFDRFKENQYRGGTRMNVSMKDRVAVVTGGSKGIGLAVARRFAESGAKVAILARGAADLKTAREALAKDGLAVKDYACDVSKAAEITRTHNQVVADFGKIDVLVN